MKKKSIRELKLEQRNFSRWDYNEYDEECKSKEQLLEEKCDIINREMIFPIQAKPPENPKFLNAEEILKLLEDISKSWTCSGEECQAAIKQVGRVLAYLTGETDEKPDSMAVAEPSELIYEYTSPLIFLGYKKPFDFEKDTEKYAQDCLDAFFEDLEGDEEFRERVLDDDDSIYEEAYESVTLQFDEGHDVERWQLEGNDDLIESQSMVNPEKLDPENYGDIATLGYAIRCELLSNVWDFYGTCEKYKNLWTKENKSNALFDAIESGEIKAVERAINAGADVNRQNKEQELPLGMALVNRDYDIAKLLIKSGADVNGKAGRDNTPIISKVSNDIESVKFLLNNGADPNAIDGGYKLTPLMYVARNSRGKTEVAKLLIKAGATVEATDEYGKTALYWAAVRENMAMVDFLLENGADIDNAKNDGESILSALIWSKNIDSLKFWLNKGLDIEKRDKSGDTPLMKAIKYRQFDVAKALLDAGADINAKDTDGKTVLFDVCGVEKEILDFAIKHGIDIEIKNNDGETALLYAVKRGNYDTAKLLLEAGANPNAVNNNGKSISDALDSRERCSPSDAEEAREFRPTLDKYRRKTK